MAANAHGQPLLQTFQKHIEDMRNLILCKICIKPLYEPYILSCGHSYCYSCLTSWFMGGDGDRRRRQNMKCPDCRAPVILQPSPNYVLRDIVHMFISRVELLPEDETTHEHELAKEEEAVQMTADRNTAGLFKGSFPHSGDFQHPYVPGHRAPMHDPHDNVERCPECTWELEDGQCNQCGWSISDDDAFSDDVSDEEANGRHPDSIASPNTASVIAGLGDYYGNIGRSVSPIGSDVDDIDPVDQEFAGNDAEPHSDAESDLPLAMGGQHRPNLYRRFRRHQVRGYESDRQSTNYGDSEMGDTNLERSSEIGDSDSDGDEDESEMDDFVEHDTPVRIPRRRARQGNFIDHPSIVISDDDDESDEQNTNRELSQASTTSSTRSATTAESETEFSSSEESSEDESRRTPVPRSRPSFQSRVVLDDSDEDQSQQSREDESRRTSIPRNRPSYQRHVVLDDSGEDQSQENPLSDDSKGDESDITTIPAQPTATRRSHLRNQRVRRGNNTTRRTLAVSPPRRPNAPFSRGGFDNGNGRHHPYASEPAMSRRGTRQAHVAG